jgi:hypothetical protein
MALIRVHKVMIGTALAFCTLFSARAIAVGDTLLGVFFSTITVGLAIYFRWFLKTKAAALSGEPPSGE